MPKLLHKGQEYINPIVSPGGGSGTSITKVSELENDTGFITRQDLPVIGEIPTKLSELENDTNFVTEASLNSKLGDIESILDNIIGG